VDIAISETAIDALRMNLKLLKESHSQVTCKIRHKTKIFAYDLGVYTKVENQHWCLHFDYKRSKSGIILTARNW